MLAIRKLALRAAVRRLARDEQGTIAIIFALCCFVCVMVTGLAIDIGRVMHAERSLTAAMDAAALAAAKGMRTAGLNDAEVADVARKFFDANMKGHGGDYQNIQSFAVTVDRNTNAVTIAVESEVPMIFANVGGISKIDVPKSSVAIFDTKNIEVGIQLDVTGSMCAPCSKIADLKAAIAGPNGLLDILMPDGGTSNEVRIGLAPFAAGVNAGPYAAAVTDGRAGPDGCVYERNNPALQATDVSPATRTPPLGALGRFKGRSELPGALACPSAANRVVALSDSKTTLRTAVNGMTTNGYTAGHLGAAWARGLVSPEWSNVWPTAPAQYGDGRTEKYVILMTDGIYNSQP